MEPAEIFRVVSASIVGVVASSATREERTATGVVVAPTEIVTSCAAVAGATRTLVAQGLVLRSARISVADTSRRV